MIDFVRLLACVLTRLFRSRARLEAHHPDRNRTDRVSPPCACSRISGWRDDSLYPLAGRRRAPRREETDPHQPPISILVIPVRGEPLELGRSGRTMDAAALTCFVTYARARGAASRLDRLDLVEPPGRRCGWWTTSLERNDGSADGEVGGDGDGALVIFSAPTRARDWAVRCCSTCSIGLVGAAAAGRTIRW
jgi:hypothetical protein